MRRTVTVLQDDIDNGVRGSFRWCPVARAVRRDLADLLDGRLVHVAPEALWLNEPSSTFQTPPAVAEFIHRFDSGMPGEPFKFEIEVPDQ